MKGRGLLLFSTILVLCSCNGEQQAAGKEEERLVADMTCGLDATAAGGNTYGTDCKGLYDMHSNSEFFPEIPYVKYEVLFISAHNCPNWSTISRKEMTERKKIRARISFHFELESENNDLGTCFLVGVCLISKQVS
jgi:hypothetical protein